MNRLMRSLAVTTVLVAVAAPAFAGPGIHLGGSIDPDDFLAALRFRSHPIQDAFFVVPNVEFGFGDVTMISGNLDGRFQLKTDSKWEPYVGGGITLVWYDFDNGSDTEFGGSILGGIALNTKWFFETKFGLGDVPDWKFVVGFEKP
jgi:hypothetical protein